MTIASEITRIKTNIENAYAKAEEKGATMPELLNSENLATCIESVPKGGGTEITPVPEGYYKVRLYDYDGTILSEQNVKEGEDAIIPNVPEHPHLTFAGWNCTLTAINEHKFATAMYDTEDYTEYITIKIDSEESKNFTFGLIYLSEGIYTNTIDWGDGNSESFEFTYDATGVKTQGYSLNHTYSELGVYEVKVYSKSDTDQIGYITKVVYNTNTSPSGSSFKVSSFNNLIKYLPCPQNNYLYTLVDSPALELLAVPNNRDIDNQRSNGDAGILKHPLSLKHLVVVDGYAEMGTSSNYYNGSISICDDLIGQPKLYSKKIKELCVPKKMTSFNIYGHSIEVMYNRSFNNGTNQTNLKEVYIDRTFNSQCGISSDSLEKVEFIEGSERSTDLKLSSCPKLVDIINIPTSVTNISMAKCDSLKYLDLSNLTNVTTLSSAISDCSSLEVLKLPPNLEKITTNNCFSGNSSLREIIFPATLTTLRFYSLFSNCRNLEKVIFPENVVSDSTTYDTYGLFYYCINLKEVIMPENIKCGQNTFAECYGLKKVWMPASLDLSKATGYSSSIFSNLGGKTDFIIYTDATEKPEGWGAYWNYTSSSNKAPVYWGATKENYENGDPIPA